MSLRARLLSLIVLAVSVIALITGWFFYDYRNMEIAAARQRLPVLTSDIAREINDKVLGTIQLLYGLSRARDLEDPRRDACSIFLADVLKEHPQYTGILTIKPDGNLDCDSLRTGRSLNLTDRRYFQKLSTSLQAMALEPAFGRLTGIGVIQVAYAARSETGGLRFVLLASLNLDRFVQTASKSLPFKNMVLTLVDDNGTFLARYPKTENLERLTFPAKSVDHLVRLPTDEWTRDAEGIDGIARIWAVTALREIADPGLRVLIGVPEAEITALADNKLRSALAALTIASIVVFAGAALLSEYGIRRPAGAVINAVNRLSGGDFSARIGVPHPRGEFGQLMAAVNRTAESLETTEKARGRAEDASEAKTQFLASMSHEIRTPLNAIIGYTDLLFDQNLKPEQRKLLERVRFSGAALLTVVNDILDFSKIEAGQIEIQSQPFSLQALIDNTVSIVAQLAERKGLTMEVDLGPDLPQALVGDEARIRQILLNLLNNAVKFTQRGSVTLHVRCDGPSSGRMLFSVKDTGIGIPQHQRAHLFHRFRQVNPSNTREFGGTGLGLAICKRLVELMGGKIGLESEEGEGSTFWFTVPLPRADKSAVVQPVVEATAHVRTTGRILLVEDMEHNRDLARTILMNAGHEVDLVENGAEAVAAVQTKTYDLVLMDVQMPIMDGVTATQKIRELDHPARDTPVIAMTANVLPQQVKAFGEAGMNDHVGKPFKKIELLEKVKIWLLRAAPTSSTLTPHDPSALDEIREMMGAEWVANSLTRIRQQIEETFGDDATALRDREQLAGRAHALVSHAALFGFLDLSKLCTELEEACKNGRDLSSPFQQAKASARITDGLVREILSTSATQPPELH